MNNFKAITKNNSIRKLILFNLIYLFNFSLFWILMVLCLFNQPIIVLVIYFIKPEDMINYSLLMILVPLIISFIFILFQITVLFQDSKINSIEYKLVCSKYSKLKTTISRIISIFVSLLIITLFQDIFLFFFIIVNMLKFGLALFIANTFINSFVYLFILLILTLITNKSRKVSFVIIATIIGIFTLGISLFSRPLAFNNKYNFDYNNPNSKYRYTRLVDDNQNNLLIVYENNEDGLKSTSNQIIKYINNTNMINNFIPSEWLMSFYSSLFLNMNFDLNFNDSMFNLLSIKVVDKSTTFKASNYLNYYSIRPLDINFSNLNNEEYSDLIYKNIDEIIKEYDLENNLMLTSFIYQTITKYRNWNDILYADIDNPEIIINFLKDITGINTKYNQLFYAIKYEKLIFYKIPNLFENLENIYNVNISNLIKFIFTNDFTKNNLFGDNDSVLLTNHSIDYFYPDIDIFVNNEKPSQKDLNFVKNNLLKFTVDNDNEISLSYLKSNLDYSITNNELSKLTNLFPNITDYESWSNYVDSIKTYSELNNLLFDLFTIFNDIYEYKLSNNTINIVDSSAILTPFYLEHNLGAKIIIFIYIGLFVLLSLIIYKNNKSISRKVKEKND